MYYSFEVTNKGNAVDTFNLAVDTSSLPSGWDASLDQDKISNLGVDDVLTDVLVVKAPEDAAADVETQIIVTISSDYNINYSTYTSRTTVLKTTSQN